MMAGKKEAVGGWVRFSSFNVKADKEARSFCSESHQRLDSLFVDASCVKKGANHVVEGLPSESVDGAPARFLHDEGRELGDLHQGREYAEDEDVHR